MSLYGKSLHPPRDQTGLGGREVSPPDISSSRPTAPLHTYPGGALPSTLQAMATYEDRYKGSEESWSKVPGRAYMKRKFCGVTNRGRTLHGEPLESFGKPCKARAGLRTSHLGYGECYLHGGNLPSHEQAAHKEMIVSNIAARRFYGGRRDIGPHEALAEEVQYTAGHVRWLRDTIRWLGGDPDSPKTDPLNSNFDENRLASLHQTTNMGLRPSVYLDLYERERKHLVHASKAAIDAGVAERTVKLAEDQGRLIATLINAILTDPTLALTPLQASEAPAVARKHLLALNAGPQGEPADPVMDLNFDHARVIPTISAQQHKGYAGQDGEPFVRKPSRGRKDGRKGMAPKNKRTTDLPVASFEEEEFD